MEIPDIITQRLQGLLLQRGHNFFVMEILILPLVTLRTLKLQRGHNFFVMEIHRTGEKIDVEYDASKGP